MKKRRKKYAAFMLAMVLVAGITGCTKSGSGTKNSRQNNVSELSQNDSDGQKGTETEASTEAREDTVAKGRYIETQIDTPQNFSGEGTIQRLADKSLALLDAKNAAVSISSDNGRTWDTQVVSELENMQYEVTEISGMALAEDGSAFIAYTTKKMLEDGTAPGKYLYFSIQDPENTMQKFDLNLDRVEYLNESVFTADGRLFSISTMQKVYEINLKKKSCRQLFTVDSGSDGAICSNGDLIIAADGTKAYFYDAYFVWHLFG